MSAQNLERIGAVGEQLQVPVVEDPSVAFLGVPGRLAGALLVDFAVPRLDGQLEISEVFASRVDPLHELREAFEMAVVVSLVDEVVPPQERSASLLPEERRPNPAVKVGLQSVAASGHRGAAVFSDQKWLFQESQRLGVVAHVVDDVDSVAAVGVADDVSYAGQFE